MKQFNLFARLTKIDEAKRQISGILAQECLDRSGEIFDYDRSKKHFVAWSDGISKTTDGKSVGNLRAMHGKTVAGKFSAMVFNDAEKSIEVVADVVDDNEWRKCLTGCYSGLSIGGKYEDMWEDPTNKAHKRYEAIPSEGSLVDLPCIPTATFTVMKADGLTEQRHFSGVIQKSVRAQVWTCAIKGHEHGKKEEAETCDAATEKALLAGEIVKDVRTEFAKALGVDLDKLAATATSTSDKADKDAALAAYLAKVNGPDAKGMFASAKGPEFPKELMESIGKFDADQMIAFEGELKVCKTTEDVDALVSKIAARTDTSAKSGTEKYGSVKFADEKNKKYPIDTAKHIRAAWNYINKSKNAAKYSDDDVKTIKGKIVSAWKATIDKDGPPSAKEADKSISAQALRKGLYTLSTLANQVESLFWTLESYQTEQAMEGDDSPACAMLEDGINTLLQALAMMAKEETDELLGSGEDVDVLAMSAAIQDMVKANTQPGWNADMPIYIAPQAWPAGMRIEAFAKIKEAKADDREALAKSLGMTVSKAGARHSKADMDRLQAIHDHSTGMGASCDAGKGADKAALTDALAKVTTTEGELTKAKELRTELARVVVDIAKAIGLPGETETPEVTKRVIALRDELEKLKKQPAAAKGALFAVDKLNDVSAINKATGDDSEDKPILKKDGSTDQEAMTVRAIKKAQRTAHGL